MSLTNPKDVVTEERLKDFYDGIYPYLGGMPEVLANKFSRGDIYSTTEKMIGQWSDGKPLYMKIINSTMPSEINTNKEIAIGASVDSCPFIYGFMVSAGTYQPIALGAKDSFDAFSKVSVSTNNGSAYTKNTIVVRTSASVWLDNPVCFIIQYTKTTDSAISIGVDTDYSTTEKIVGTWIDGKYIYQKSFSFTMSATSTNGTEVDNFIDVGAQVDKFISFQGIATTSAGYHDFPSIYTNGGYVRVMGYHNSTSITENKNKINVKNAWTNVNNNPAWLTVQYTKTS